MLGILLVVPYLVALVLVGLGILQFVLRRSEPLRAELWLPMAFGMGLGAQAILYFLMLVTMGRIFLVPAAFILLGVGVVGLYVGRKEFEARFLGLEFLSVSRNAGVPKIYWVLVALVILFSVLLFSNAMNFPLTSWDGRTIWTYKGKILFYEHTVFNEAFTDPLRTHYHRNYPLLLPFAHYSVFSLVGEVNERAIRVFLSSFFVFQSLFFFGILRRFGAGKMVAISVPLFYCTVPFRNDLDEVDGGVLNAAFADIPLSFFVLIAATSMMLWWREQRNWQLIIAITFSAFGVMTKSEGIIPAAAFLGANILYSLFGKSVNWRRGLAFAVTVLMGTIVLALPWLLVKRLLPEFYDEDFGKQLSWDVISQMYVRLPIILEYALREMSTITKWNYVWFAYAGFLLVAIPEWFRGRRFWLDAVILLCASAYIMTYLITPLGIVFHLDASLSRLLSQVLPLVLIRLGLYFHDHYCLIIPTVGGGAQDSASNLHVGANEISGT